MIKITTKEYDKAINFILEFDRSLPKELRSEVIIQNGHISHPGVSDLDIIFFFKDEFFNCSYFLQLFKRSVIKLENYPIFFHHLPHILPLSCLNSLPLMSYNPANELKILKGKVNFLYDNIGFNQNILNSFEQIHNRITSLINLYLTSTKNIKALLLNGHSISHSISSVNQMGFELKTKDFKTFTKIENLREILSSNLEYEIKNYNELRKGLIDEFYFLLKLINKKIEDKILAHFSKNQNIHKYNQEIYLVNLNKKLEGISFNQTKKNIFVEGFSWQTLCLFENYFLEKDNFRTIFKDLNFEKDIKKRISYLKKIFIFNFNNFNSPEGRSLFHPLVKGSYLNSLSRRII